MSIPSTALLLSSRHFISSHRCVGRLVSVPLARALELTRTLALMSSYPFVIPTIVQGVVVINAVCTPH